MDPGTDDDSDVAASDLSETEGSGEVAWATARHPRPDSVEEFGVVRQIARRGP
jgi:hypothetical protein